MARNDKPTTHRSKWAPQDMRHPATHGAGEAMVEEGRDEEAGNDRHGASEFRRQQDRQQLRLVAHFTEQGRQVTMVVA